MPDERPERPIRPPELPRHPSAGKGKRHSSGGWQLLVVQSISCLVVLLIAFLMKLAGGAAFDQLRESFNAAIMDNSFTSTLAGLLDSSEKEGETTTSAESGGTTAPSETGATTGEPAAGDEDASSTDGETGETTAQETTVAPDGGVGGNDVSMQSVKPLVAPEGATFAKLEVNQLAKAPLAEGHITSWFGYREDPIKGGIGFHTGIDIGAEKGAPISAMYYGTVTDVGTDKSLGNYVKIYHGGGLEILYGHCSEIIAEKGMVVRAGDVVARVGSTGDSTGNHLHVTARVGGTAYDPYPLFAEGLYG